MIGPTPIPTRFVIEDAKVRAYLLDPSHEEGGAKCAFLVSVGFSIDDPATLKQALLRHPTSDRLVRTVVTPFGRRFHFDGPLPCPGGAFANVRTVWQVDRDPLADVARVITLKPLPKPSR
ncbi:hypothetical protein ASG52_11190 [Methylobacterium sp. Leaf456]|uniref:DUF6883 domain-containing protein n=1 Tax=Methylobacterium sp. Leaf456 TaxID=1736382 RepID=UPI0006F943CD|nr:DUF6883 domain-containing protein [Methylobacterium sp. Leaf456]KQT47822.1 hypothetical protein ASG52_11190 [Methylobacterium sp. Leaf456]